MRAFVPLLGATSLVGCGGSAESAREWRSELTDTVCNDAGEIEFLSGVDAAEPFDYLAMREAVGEPENVEIREAVGKPCITGADDCEAILAMPIESDSDFTRHYQFPVYLDFAVTRGNEAELLTTEARLLEFLGEIDTPSEAALIAHLHHYVLDCNGNNVMRSGDGFIVYGEVGTGCPEDIRGNLVAVDSDGAVRVLKSKVAERGDPNCVIGRLPAGLVQHSSGSGRVRSPVIARDAGHAVGAFYGEVAHLEAAAVHAFAQLTGELVLHRAPASLIRQALHACADERRHARVTRALAARYGHRALDPRVVPSPPRELEGIALDNVREGLIRETFGALVGHHQARHASDPVIRRAARAIARDETRHAVLSWEMHRWLLSRLSRAARRRAADAFHAELDALRMPFCHPPHPDVQRLAGMPSEAESRKYYRGLERRLWRHPSLEMG